MSNKIIYTAKDYDSLFEELKTKAQDLFPDWTDFSESNIGVVFLELFAMMGDMLAYYENRHANEGFIGTVTQRKNMIALCKLIGYKLSTKEPATVELKFTLDNVHGVKVLMPESIVCETEDGNYKFENIEAGEILAGATEISLDAKNQIARQDFFTGDGTENQKFLLSEIDYISESAVIDVDGDPTWTEVEDFLNSGVTDKHFKMVNDADNEGNDIAYLVFGDGVNGSKPTGDIQIDYKTGGGIGANSIQADKITKIVSTIYDENTDVVNDINVTNDSSPNGGADSETITETRIKAPKSIKTSNRTVTKEDFEIHAVEVDGVARALAECWKQDPLIPENTTYVYLVPNGGGVPTQTLKDEVQDVYDNINPIVITHKVEIKNPLYEVLTIAGIITAVDGYTQVEKDDLKVRVDSAITTWFDYITINDNNEYNVDFGKEIPLSVLYDIIQSVAGVKKVDLTSPASNFTMDSNEIVELDILTGLTVA